MSPRLDLVENIEIYSITSYIIIITKQAATDKRRSDDITSLMWSPAQISTADLKEPSVQTSAENINYHPDPLPRLESRHFTFQKIFFSIRICLGCLYRQDSLILGYKMRNLKTNRTKENQRRKELSPAHPSSSPGMTAQKLLSINQEHLVSTRFKQEKVLKDFWNTTKQEEDYLRTRGSDLDCKSFSLSFRFSILLILILGTLLCIIGTNDIFNELEYELD